MNAIEKLSGDSGVAGIVLGDVNGDIQCYSGEVSPDITASVSAVAVQALSEMGVLLGATKLHTLVLNGKQSTVICRRDRNVATVFVKAKNDTQKVIDTLTQSDWVDTPNTLPDTVPPPPKPAKSSIPPKPEVHTLKSLRLALFFGDVSSAKVLQVELARLSYPNKRESAEYANFETALTSLTHTISRLLIGALNTEPELNVFVGRLKKIDESLYWAGLIWQSRLYLALGETDISEEKAREAYMVSRELDSDTKMSSICTLANTYIMSGKYDSAFNALKSSFGIASRCQIQAIQGMAYLTESQALAMKRLHLQAQISAKKAADILPRSPYPKLMNARLALLRKDFEKARAYYTEILMLNPTQPDAIEDLNILALVESNKLSLTHAGFFFARRELAPTPKVMGELMAFSQKAPELPLVKSLIVWRLLGQYKTDDAYQLYRKISSVAKSHRFKPNIVIGFGPSSIIAAGYQSMAEKLNTALERMKARKDNSGAGREDTPFYLSLPPSELQEMIENGSQDSLFSGELKIFSLPELLEFLRNGKRTGSLICSSKEGVGAVEVSNGQISSAIVPEADNIGTLLLKKGKISKEALSRAVDTQQKDLAGTRIGAVLVEKGLVDAETIRAVIVEQTFSAIKQMMSWRDGRFVFTPAFEQETNKSYVEVKLDSQYVLMEIFRQIDEGNR